jgi:hypothetical protein
VKLLQKICALRCLILNPVACAMHTKDSGVQGRRARSARYSCSSPLTGEDTGEGERCGRPLSLSLSHTGEREPKTEHYGIIPPHLSVPSIQVSA